MATEPQKTKQELRQTRKKAGGRLRKTMHQRKLVIARPFLCNPLLVNRISMDVHSFFQG
jgi:hypothetical protein